MEIFKKMDHYPISIKVEKDKQHLVLKIIYLEPIISYYIGEALKCLLLNGAI